MRYSQEMNVKIEVKNRRQLLYNKMRRFGEILSQKETIAYIIVGTLTTGVNLTAYYWFYNISGISNLVSNAFAWIVAMLFAYYANAKYVFKPTKKGLVGELLQMSKFFTARFLSFLVEEAAMFVFVDILCVNSMLIKAIMNVVVVIINYFFSKWLVFNDSKKRGMSWKLKRNIESSNYQSN
ncbi:GtrA family protein [Anaerosporobacter sp.]|uniref:GtrA family protein n=1 Tax=Anaerosporobacter sp. TaxID=1872529 RepID=UPI00286ED3B1|nr:GtrA family protein [Anaerosporobacter sp.]